MTEQRYPAEIVERRRQNDTQWCLGDLEIACVELYDGRWFFVLYRSFENASSYPTREDAEAAARKYLGIGGDTLAGVSKLEEGLVQVSRKALQGIVDTIGKSFDVPGDEADDLIDQARCELIGLLEQMEFLDAK